jgi:hypothetical protein
VTAEGGGGVQERRKKRHCPEAGTVGLCVEVLFLHFFYFFYFSTVGRPGGGGGMHDEQETGIF